MSCAWNQLNLHILMVYSSILRSTWTHPPQTDSNAACTASPGHRWRAAAFWCPGPGTGKNQLQWSEKNNIPFENTDARTTSCCIDISIAWWYSSWRVHGVRGLLCPFTSILLHHVFHIPRYIHQYHSISTIYLDIHTDSIKMSIVSNVVSIKVHCF